MQAPGPEYKFHNQLGAVIAWLIGRVRAPASLLMASSHDIDDLSPSLRVLSRLCNAAASRDHDRLTRKWSRRARRSVRS